MVNRQQLSMKVGIATSAIRDIEESIYDCIEDFHDADLLEELLGLVNHIVNSNRRDVYEADGINVDRLRIISSEIKKLLIEYQ